MDLIERYVREVGRRLPRQQREDVQTELRSLLQDMVEDRAQTKVERADEEVVVAVLKEFGPPEKVAASYQTRPQYLIGPQLFPIFKIVLTIVAIVLGSLALFGAVVTNWGSDELLADGTRFLVQAIPGLIGALVNAFGVIVIVFAILERVVPAEEFDEEKEESWNPRELPAVNKAAEINRGEVAGGIVFAVILLMLVNAFPQWAALLFVHNEQWTAVPLLSENFHANLLPWFNLLLLLSIVVDIYKVRLEQHNQASQLLDIGVALFTAVVFYIFLSNGPVFGINATLAETTSFSQEAITLFVTVFNGLERTGLPLLIVIQLLTAVKKSYDLWRRREPGMSTLAGKLS